MASAAETKRTEAQIELEKNRIALEYASRASQFLLSEPAGAAVGANIGQDKWPYNYRKALTSLYKIYREML